MDVRYSPEQVALRDAAARFVADLGPRTVAEYFDESRREKIETALAATGWRDIRDDASTVEAAIVVEELARGLVPVRFLEGLARWDGSDVAVGLALTSADLVGVMTGAVRLAVDYARDRKQYGAPIGSFQAVQHMLADAFTVSEGARSIALHAAWAVDALPDDEAVAAGAAAKAYCSRAAREVCEIAIQVHGGIGNTWECMAHLFLRRALAVTALYGGVGENLERVLAHGLR